MVGGDDYSTAMGHILNTVELNLPEQATEEANNGPKYFKRPLWKCRAAGLRSRFHLFRRICTVAAQVDPYLTTAIPYL
jgi:hypothetical protein